MSQNQTMRPLDPTLADSFGLPKWLTENLRLIIGAIVAALVLAGAVGVWQWQTKRAAQQASDELGAILIQKKARSGWTR